MNYLYFNLIFCKVYAQFTLEAAKFLNLNKPSIYLSNVIDLLCACIWKGSLQDLRDTRIGFVVIIHRILQDFPFKNLSRIKTCLMVSQNATHYLCSFGIPATFGVGL